MSNPDLVPGALSKYPGGKTWKEDRRERKLTAAATLREVYALVDHRDGGKCRICGRRCSTTAVSFEDRAERHHVIPRSLGGEDSTHNLATVCWECHEDRHKKGTLKIAGDADERNEMGYLCGLDVERLTDAGWKKGGMR